MNGTEFIKLFEEKFPLQLAYTWDNVGLQIGTLNKDVSKILLSLDLTYDVVEEAIKKGAELIIVHHPLIFSPLKSIKTDSVIGQIVELVLKNDIAIYVAHTNFDISNFGMNKILADKLKLQNQEIIDFTTEDEGLGRIGTLSSPVVLKDYVREIKELFHLDSVKLIGDENEIIKKVAISGGSGSSIMNKVKSMKADLYISGDITYHHALDAIGIGLIILDVGHNIEKYSLLPLQDLLSSMTSNVKIEVSSIDTNPYKNL